MTTQLPFDDHKLEMEETEGFLPSPSPAKKQTTKKENRAYGNRWACVMLFVGVMLGVLLTSDTESLRFWEGTAGENVGDVEEKANEPTLTPSSPLSAKPTPLPTIVVPATPEPTPLPTPEPTPGPTDAVVVATPQPTDVVTPKPPDVVAVTPNPTDADSVPKPTDEPAKAAPANGVDGAVPKEDINAKDVDFGPDHYPKPSKVVKPDPPLTPERAEPLAKEWGKWEFVDKKSDQRPKDDYCAQFPNRDIPRDKFPANAWQTDTEYLKDWLDQSGKLVDRALEAILSEYGHGKKDEANKSFEEREKEMFEWLILEPGAGPKGKNLVKEAGWTTAKSYQGLVRRVLHSVMTQDTFTFIVGGHSAAAGHGNHFKQSYGMQFHKVMEPVFGLLGVSLFSHNVAQGGVGTIQHSLGFKDIYGDKIDMMVWDSGMTEGRDQAAVDMYWIQALISGERVPFLMGAGSQGPLLYYNQNADADIGNFGEGTAGVPECTDEAQCDKFAYAARYLKCSTEAGQLCAEHKWQSNCWVERADVTPVKKQAAHPTSQVKWHPGFRAHQLIGRNMAFLVLKALKEGLATWAATANYALPDDTWHVTDYYANIRNKVHAKEGETQCFKNVFWPARMCSTPMRAYTEWQPRPNPETTSLTSILKPALNGYKAHIHPGNLYNGPDVHNPFTAIPEGEIDVLSIISNGRTFVDDGKRRRLANEAIEPGLGAEFGNHPRPGYCDASYNSECGRQGDCLLLGHGDTRGCIAFDSYSGWLVLTLPKVKEGIIVSKIESYHGPTELPASRGWKSIDNKGRRHLRGLGDVEPHGNSTFLLREPLYDAEADGRKLKKRAAAQQPAYCDDFKFEFAIDGKITAWDKTKYVEMDKVVQRVVEIQTLLDDPNFTKEPKDVELAIRMTGCGDSTKKTFCLTHLYFA